MDIKAAYNRFQQLCGAEGAQMKAWLWLRIAVLLGAGFGTLFWLGTLVQWWVIPHARRDGFELLGVVLSTLFFLVLVLPALVLGVLGRWLVLAAVLAGLVAALASDTLVPWIPWP